MSNEGALANLDYESALAEIASGVLSKTIAGRYNVTPRGLRKALAKHPDYDQAIKDQAASIVEEAVEYVNTCTAETVPIARVRADTAFKYAAARDPERWGQRNQLSVTMDISANLSEALERSRQRLSERVVESVSVTYPQAIQGDLPKNEADST